MADIDLDAMTCTRCDKSFDLSFFPKNGKGGRCHYCKFCKMLHDKKVRDNDAWREKQRAYRKSIRTDKHRESARPRTERARKKFPLKQVARHAVSEALKRGTLIRPETCELCGEIPERFSDGRSSIQAHHDDYEKPLAVRWLCQLCHTKEHRALTPPEETSL